MCNRESQKSKIAFKNVMKKIVASLPKLVKNKKGRGICAARTKKDDVSIHVRIWIYEIFFIHDSLSSFILTFFFFLSFFFPIYLLIILSSFLLSVIFSLPLFHFFLRLPCPISRSFSLFLSSLFLSLSPALFSLYLSTFPSLPNSRSLSLSLFLHMYLSPFFQNNTRHNDLLWKIQKWKKL